MLIINADDFGRSLVATDNALALHAQRRISSASAMVFMADSVRAASLAHTAGLDVGLHVNLSESFTGQDVPTVVRDAHERIRTFLTSSKYALVLYHPLLRPHFDLVLAAQYAEFERLYRKPPTHFDGHQHMHLASNVLLQQLLPNGSKVRRSFSFISREKSVLNRWYRDAVNRHLAKRYRITDYFFSLAQHLSIDRMERLVQLALVSDVELMAHPELVAEHRFLLSEELEAVLSRVRLGGYDVR